MPSSDALATIAQEFVARIGRAARVTVLVLDYGLAPESRIPSPSRTPWTPTVPLLDDAFAPERVVIAGDSAGGGLTLATLVALRDRGIPLPARASRSPRGPT